MNVRRRSLFFPMLLMAIGVVLFLTNIGTLEGPAWDILAKYWPAILILGGLDGLYRGESWVGTLVLLGLGTILLLGNLGTFEFNGWQLLLRLWPVLLVAAGLDLALGRRHSIWGILVRVAVGALMVAAIFWLAVASPFAGSMRSVELSQTLDKATSASIDLGIAAGELNVNAGDQPGLLINGVASIPKNTKYEPFYQVTASGKGQYRIQTPGSVVPGSLDSMKPWRIAVNREIPLELIARLGAGDMNIDLTGTHATAIQSEIGAGSIEIILPESQTINGKISVGVGEIDLHVPQCAAVTLQTGTALVDLHLPAGYSREGEIIRNIVPSGCEKNIINLKLDLAIGSLTIEKIL